MIKRVLAGFVVLAVAGLALTSCGTVESGNVGVRTTLGRMNPDEVEPGLYTRVVIRSLTTDPAIEKAIQESVAAQKQLETTKQRIAIAEAEAQVEVKRAEGIAQSNHIINQSLTREYLQHESNLVLQKFAEKGGTTTVVLPANIQTAPLINLGK